MIINYVQQISQRFVQQTFFSPISNILSLTINCVNDMLIQVFINILLNLFKGEYFQMFYLVGVANPNP